MTINLVKDRIYLIKIFFLTTLFISILLFIFYLLRGDNSKNIINIKLGNKSVSNFNEVVTNPKLQLYNKGKLYNIVGDSAIYGKEELLIYNVLIERDDFNIKAGKLLIEKNSENMYFSENPVMIIH